MSKDRIKVNATVKYKRYFKDNWGIVTCEIENVLSGKVQEYGDVTFKGQMPTPEVGNMYTIIADYVVDPKWGGQYDIVSMWLAMNFDENDEVGKKKFLMSIFTPTQVQAMYEALENPFDALKNRDMQSLVKVKGCKLKTADAWCRKFNQHFKKAKIYIELENYDLSEKMVDRLLRVYKSPDVIIEKIKNNPYILVNEVDGIGWKRADEMALKGGINPLGALRVSEYIKYYLDYCGEQGKSWVDPDQLLGAILDEIGDDVTDETITEAIRMADLWHNEDKTKIGLKEYRNLAMMIAIELIRIRNAESKFDYNGWRDRIKNVEEANGWEYTDEQLNGIETALKENVVVIHGSAGTGKSSLVSGVLAALPNNSHVMCALAGRASARLAEITGDEGYTIHRLLGYPKGEPKNQYFLYNQDRQLGYDIYILDEISMVSATLFYFLIRAIPSGSKLIMLGDPAQLEAIGNGNVAYDLIHSDEISDIPLTKIHRQAAKSAIITESMKIRNGEQLVEKDWSGKEIRGELEDLEIDCYLDESNSYYKVMQYFQRLLAQKDFNILETQVIVPVKKRGGANTYNLNNDIQELYNPARSNKREETVMTISSGLRVFREGDKIINTVNNYKVEPTVYNGNIGIFKYFESHENEDGVYDDYMVIDFVGIGRVEIPKDDWCKLDLGYAITIHKAQGDQGDYIIMCLDMNSYTLLTRQLIYTGITRAKKKCFLIAQTKALRYGTFQEAISQKQTHLQDCLYKVTHPKLVF